jgi:hypothetical protein
MDIPTRRLPPGVTIAPGSAALQIQITWANQGWSVVYPIIPELDGDISRYRPGYLTQWTSMPLYEFLNMLADEYKLPHVFIANID